jgi:Rrf2 family transcriptional regulator, nitric oxide-sensitive transcriptional repressor
MRVTLNTDYSLRVLMFLATKQGRLATIPEIAESYEISRAHLMKVVHQLGLLGYIATTRGKNGGIRLLRKAADINVGQVVRDTEEGLAVLGCLDDPAYCVIAKVCTLRGAFREATEAFLAVLDRYSLEDLARPRTALSNLLDIAPTPKAPARGS